MRDYDKTNPPNKKNRELLSALKLTFGLENQTIIGHDED